MPVETNSTDSVLGNQGTQDFTSMISGAPQTAPGRSSSGPTQSDPNSRSDGGGGVPRKSVADVEGAAGDGAAAGGDGAATGTSPPSAGGQPGAPATGTAAAPTANQALIDSLTESMVAASRKASEQIAGQQQGKSADAALTPEQFDAKYKVARPNEQLIAGILGQDPKVAVSSLHQYGQNLVQQAILMTLDLVDAQVGEKFKTIEPHIASWQQHQATIREEKAKADFYKTHPDLVGEEDLVTDMKDAVIARINSGQLKVKDINEGFSVVASAARNFLKKYRPNGAPAGGNGAGGQGNASNSSGNGRQMSAASSAGRSGTGQPTPQKTVAEEIFGADAR